MIYQNEFATREHFSSTPLMLIITSFIPIALFLIHIYKTAFNLFDNNQRLYGAKENNRIIICEEMVLTLSTKYAFFSCQGQGKVPKQQYYGNKCLLTRFPNIETVVIT